MAYENVTPPALPEYNSTKFLYNGIHLPDIDTVWVNKDTYEHASIGKYISVDSVSNNGNWNGIVSEYILVLHSGRVYYRGDNLIEFPRYNEWSIKFYSLSEDSNTWVLEHSSSNNGYSSIWWSLSSAVWTSHNITNPDNSLIFEGSDPTSILEYPYHVLVFDYSAKESDWYQVHLYYSATAFTYNGSTVTNTGTVFK